MPLISILLAGNARLQDCLLRDTAHVVPGESGEHVSLIQQAVFMIDGVALTDAELANTLYGQTTAAAVLAYKIRNGIKRPGQNYDNIVGKGTIAHLDADLVAMETPDNPDPIAFPAFPGQLDAECKSILDPMFAAPSNSMMRAAAAFAAGELPKKQAICGMMLSSHAARLLPLLPNITDQEKEWLNNATAKMADSFAAFVPLSSGQGCILINSKHFRRQSAAIERYAEDNDEWRAALAHELNHALNRGKFDSAWALTSDFFVDIQKANAIKSAGNDPWFSIYMSCNELAARFVNWYVWEEIVLPAGSLVDLPSPETFFARAYVEMRDELAGSGSYDKFKYLSHIKDLDSLDNGDRLARQTALLLGHTALKYQLFDKNLQQPLCGGMLFLSAKAEFDRQKALGSQEWKARLPELLTRGSGLH